MVVVDVVVVEGAALGGACDEEGAVCAAETESSTKDVCTLKSAATLVVAGVSSAVTALHDAASKVRNTGAINRRRRLIGDTLPPESE